MREYLVTIYIKTAHMCTNGDSSFVGHQKGDGSFSIPLVPTTMASFGSSTAVDEISCATLSPEYLKVFMLPIVPIASEQFQAVPCTAPGTKPNGQTLIWGWGGGGRIEN